MKRKVDPCPLGLGIRELLLKVTVTRNGNHTVTKTVTKTVTDFLKTLVSGSVYGMPAMSQ
jgi:hypothetical protein